MDTIMPQALMYKDLQQHKAGRTKCRIFATYVPHVGAFAQEGPIVHLGGCWFPGDQPNLACQVASIHPFPHRFSALAL